MVSMEFLLQIIFSCLKCWRVVASGFGALCSTWFFLSLAVGRKHARFEARSGIDVLSQQLDALPLARTGAEFAMLAVAALSCWGVVWLLIKIERSY